ncbi:hypothetical protein C365_01680 [Cryptococcus neoformans Bt85]|nr:hypothetical protein C365_01680 [Cryptococcus neoformans var. grubii Bt85]
MHLLPYPPTANHSSLSHPATVHTTLQAPIILYAKASGGTFMDCDINMSPWLLNAPDSWIMEQVFLLLAFHSPLVIIKYTNYPSSTQTSADWGWTGTGPRSKRLIQGRDV